MQNKSKFSKMFLVMFMRIDFFLNSMIEKIDWAKLDCVFLKKGKNKKTAK